MDDIRESILSLDNSVKVLSAYFERDSSLELQAIDDQLNQFEKRWRILVNNVEEISSRVSRRGATKTKFLFVFS